MNIEHLSAPTSNRSTLEKYLPALLAIGVAWLLARGLKKAFWSAIGLYWAWRFMPW